MPRNLGCPCCRTLLNSSISSPSMLKSIILAVYPLCLNVEMMYNSPRGGASLECLLFFFTAALTRSASTVYLYFSLFNHLTLLLFRGEICCDTFSQLKLVRFLRFCPQRPEGLEGPRSAYFSLVSTLSFRAFLSAAGQ